MSDKNRTDYLYADTDDFKSWTEEEAKRLQVDPGVALRMFGQESGFNPSAKSYKGASGISQMMPATRAYIEKKYGIDASTPKGQITGGLLYLKEHYDEFGAWDLAAAAYHAGPGAVRKAGNKIPNTSDGLMKTKDYSRKIAGGAPSGSPEKLLPRERVPEQRTDYLFAEAVDELEGTAGDVNLTPQAKVQKQRESPGIYTVGSIPTDILPTGNIPAAKPSPFKFRPELEEQFEQLKSSGNLDEARKISSQLQGFGYEVGEGEGLPYIKRPDSFHLNQTTSPGANGIGARLLDRRSTVQRLSDAQKQTPPATRMANEIVTERDAKNRQQGEYLAANGTLPAEVDAAAFEKEGRAGFMNSRLEALSRLSPERKQKAIATITAKRPLTDDERKALGAERGLIERGIADISTGATNAVGAILEGYSKLSDVGLGDPLSAIGNTLGINTPADSAQIAADKLNTAARQVRNEKGGQGVVDDVFSGAGSSLPYFAGGWFGAPAVALMGMAGNAGSVYREAIESGADEKTARQAALMAAPVGTLEAFGLGGTAGRVGSGAIKGILKTVLYEMGEEGTQEAINQAFNNLIAQGLYDPRRGVLKDVAYNAFIGAITGGVIGGGSHAIASGLEKIGNRQSEVQSQESGVGSQKSIIHTPLMEKISAEQVQSEVDQHIGLITRQAEQAKAELIAQEQEQTPAPVQTPVPEAATTIAAQLEAMRLGSREAVLVTPGEQMPEIPPGYRATQTREGIFIHRPEIDGRQIHEMVRDGSFGELLGHVAPKPQEGAPSATVAARDAEGNELQTSVVPAELAGQQAQSLGEQFPDAQIEIGGEEAAANILNGRVKETRTDEQLQTGTPDTTELPASGDSLPAVVDVAANEAATSPVNDRPEPTEGQIEAGNYKKGHARIGGLNISIENPAGSKRRPEWPTLRSHYGYIRRTEGADGEHIDVFVKEKTPADYSGAVYVVDQSNKDGSFDEHKVMLGFESAEAARAGYAENFTGDWTVGPIREFASVSEFRDWLKTSDTTKPAAEGDLLGEDDEDFDVSFDFGDNIIEGNAEPSGSTPGGQINEQLSTDLSIAENPSPEEKAEPENHDTRVDRRSYRPDQEPLRESQSHGTDRLRTGHPETLDDKQAGNVRPAAPGRSAEASGNPPAGGGEGEAVRPDRGGDAQVRHAESPGGRDTDPAGAGDDGASSRLIPVTDAESAATAWRKVSPKTSPEQERALTVVFDALARGYVRMNPGKTEDDYYRLFAGFGKADETSDRQNRVDRVSSSYEIRPGESATSRKLASNAIRDTGDISDRAKSASERSGNPGGVSSGTRRRLLSITDSFERHPRIDLRGQKVQSAHDIAELAQVYRDPRFETFRIIYLKGDTVVAHEGISSRLPGANTAFLFDKHTLSETRRLREERKHAKTPDESDRLRKEIDRVSEAGIRRQLHHMRERMNRLGADGYYLLHNHPSGYSNPSADDLTVTGMVAAKAQGFKGHVIIDSNEYSVISPDANGPDMGVSVKTHEVDFGKDELFTPAVPGPLVNAYIADGDSDRVASIGKWLQSPDGWVPILYRSSVGELRAIEEIPAKLFNRKKEAADFIRGRQRMFGAADAVAYSASEDLFDAGVELMMEGALSDMVTQREGARREGIQPAQNQLDPEGLLPGFRVESPAWHGSPHKFDKFTLDHIGSGEGAQAYGYGLYFAESEDVARFYKEKLSRDFFAHRYEKDGRSIQGDEVLAEYFKTGRIVEGYAGKDEVVRFIPSPENKGWGWSVEVRKVETEYGTKPNAIDSRLRIHSTLPSERRIQQVLKAEGWTQKRGALYKVDLAPKEDEYLHWDKSLIEQSEKVKAALASDPDFVNLTSDNNQSDNRFFNSIKFAPANGQELYDALSKRLGSEADTGKLPEWMKGTVIPDAKAASEYLNSLGVRGIKYLDGSSRSRGEGAFNYVIFDAADVVIEEVLFQKEKGATRFLEDGTSVISAFEAADISTALHELAHVARRYLDAESLKTAGEWAGAKNGDWTRQSEEIFARGFERYLLDGKTALKGLGKVFQQMKEWLSEIYREIAGSDIDLKLTPEIRQVFDRMLGANAKTGKPQETVDEFDEPDVLGTPKELGSPTQAMPSGRKPKSLSEWVRSMGGIKENGIEDTGKLKNKESGSTGLINNKTGHLPDTMREYALDEGYLDPESDEGKLATHFLDAVLDDFNGVRKFYRAEDRDYFDGLDDNEYEKHLRETLTEEEWQEYLKEKEDTKRKAEIEEIRRDFEDGREFPLDTKAADGFKKGKVSSSDVIQSYEKVMRAAGSAAPIRTGRFNTRMALGIYKTVSNVVRLKVTNDIPTAAHEIGHALQKAIFKNVKASAFRALTPEIKTELQRLGKALYGERKPAGGYTVEGFAEFMRYYLTRDDAERVAPKTFAWFTKTLLPDNPKVAQGMANARAVTDTYRKEGAKNRADANLVRGKSGRQIFDTWLNRVKAIPTLMIDELTPLIRLSEQVEKSINNKLAAAKNPFKVASFLRGGAPAVTQYMVWDGMVDFARNKVGSPLADAAAIVKGKKEDFTRYLWAKRSIERWSKGKNPGMTLEDARAIVDDLDSPEFQLAAQKVYDWNEGVLNYVREAVPSLANAIEAIKANSENYVPLMRAFDDLDTQIGKGKKGKGEGKLLPGMKGSGRRVLDIFPQMIVNAEQMIAKAHRRKVLDTIVGLAEYDDVGHIIEEVPRDRVPQEVRVSEIANKLEEMGADLTGVDLDEALTFFAPAYFPKGKDPIVPVMANGHMRWFQVSSELYETLNGIDLYRLGPILDLLFGKANRLFRLGTTGLRPAFSLITNPARDIQTFMLQSESKNPVAKAGAYLDAMAAAVDPRRLKGRRSGPLDLFYRLGANMAQPLGQDINVSRRAANELFQGKTRRIVTHPIESLRELWSVTESVPRVAELEVVAKEIGWNMGDQLSLDQAIQLGLAAKTVTIDFTAAGKLGKVFNQMIPFFNANIQGTRYFAKQLKDNPRGATLQAFVYLTLPTLYLWWEHKDEEWYKDMPDKEKYLYWHFKVGNKIIQIPRAFEWANIFATLPEALFDAAYRKEPERLKDGLGYILDTSTPPYLPHVAQVAKEQLQNRVDFFDRPIVPRAHLDLPPGDQRNEYTSQIATWLGDAFPDHISPERVDHLVRGIGGGAAADLSQFVDAVTGKDKKKREPEASDIPVAGRLFRRGGVVGTSSKALEKFYDEHAQALARQKSKIRPETDKEKRYREELEDASTAIKLLREAAGEIPGLEARGKIVRQMRKVAETAVKQTGRIGLGVTTAVPVDEKVRMKVDAEMYRLGIHQTLPDDDATIARSKVKLTPEELAQYRQERIGREYTAASLLIDTPGYRQLNDTEKADTLKRYMDAYGSLESGRMRSRSSEKLPLDPLSKIEIKKAELGERRREAELQNPDVFVRQQELKNRVRPLSPR